MVGRRLVSRTVCALGLTIAACAHRPPPTLRSARLSVETSPSGGVAPFIHAKVAGHPMKLLLDTGAFQSVLPRGFAEAHHLASRARQTNQFLVDSNGRVFFFEALPDVPVQFDGENASGWLDFIIGPSDSRTEGILAPQEIVQRGFALVIDLARGELRYEREEEALKSIHADANGPPRQLDYRKCIKESFFDRGHRIVTATINGVQADMLVDTGASHTALARNNPAIASMRRMQGNRGATAGAVSIGQSLFVEDVPIVVAEASFVLPVIVQPASNPCWDGALGADLLRHCALVWGYSSLWAACRAPAASK